MKSILASFDPFDDQDVPAVSVKKNDLEQDLLNSQWILKKTRSSEIYSQHLYAALCNNAFLKLEVMTLLKNDYWSCSWRYAGGIIAKMRGQGDYIDWYCSGIIEEPTEEVWESWTYEQQDRWINIYSKFIPEGQVTDEIREDLKSIEWIVSQHIDKF
jgi:hypothetical protein